MLLVRCGSGVRGIYANHITIWVNAERSCCATSARTDRRRPDATASHPTPAVCRSALFDAFFGSTRANTTTRAGLRVRRAASRARTASQTRLPRRLLAEPRHASLCRTKVA
jgi:hypothetical protein